MHIRHDDLSGPEIRALLDKHLQHMHAVSPPESVHALDLARLRAPDIAFWTVWEAGALLGCGALRQIDAQHAEIKSMHTQAEHRGRGVARALLAHIVQEAQQRGCTRLSLETGTQAAFEPARRLYARFGFARAEPFDHYRADPCSAFMSKALTAGGTEPAPGQEAVGR